MTPKASKTDDGGQPAVMMTARQLVATVCVLLLLGGGLMTAGIWLGMRQAEPQQATGTAPSGPRATTESPRERGRQTSPVDFPSVMPPAVPEEPPYTDVIPPAEAPEDPAAREDAGDTPPDAIPAEPEVPEPQADLQPVEAAPEALQPEPGPGAVRDTLDADDTGGDADEQSSAITRTTIYSIQVAAFRTSERAKAEAFAEDHAALDPELVTSPDGDWVRILVGRYTTRAEASARQEELSERNGFEDCWVQERQP